MKQRRKRFNPVTLAIIILLPVLPGIQLEAGSSNNFEHGKKLSEGGDHNGALVYFLKAVKSAPSDW
ncbi:MAG: hypothetical protein KAW12_01655 [Candidatus Aminicenantes bacterium]|nr:hypothetical protein [Candidatus Aminicenantes bacterium]